MGVSLSCEGQRDVQMLGHHSLSEGVRIPSHISMSGASTPKAIDCYVSLCSSQT